MACAWSCAALRVTILSVRIGPTKTDCAFEVASDPKSAGSAFTPPHLVRIRTTVTLGP